MRLYKYISRYFYYVSEGTNLEPGVPGRSRGMKMNGFAKVDGPSKIGRSLGIGEILFLSVLSKNQTVIEVWSKWTVIRLQVNSLKSAIIFFLKVLSSKV